MLNEAKIFKTYQAQSTRKSFCITICGKNYALDPISRDSGNSYPHPQQLEHDFHYRSQ